METDNKDLNTGNPNQENKRNSTRNPLSDIEANKLELGLRRNQNDKMFYIAITKAKDLPKNRVLDPISINVGFLSTLILNTYQKLDEFYKTL